ncbi:hypothetical protein D3C87_824160 [compost metagenome]
MALPFCSPTVMVFSVSGLILSAILMVGFKMVCGSSTESGMAPYMRIGKSFTVWACGCRSVMLAKTFGAISFSALNLNWVCPALVSTQKVLSTRLPFSIEINALPSFPVGMVSVISSPTVNFSLLAVKESIEASVGLLPCSRCAQPGQSI